MSHKFAVFQEPVFLSIEEHDHYRADVVLSDQARAFEANGDRAFIVVSSRRAWHRVDNDKVADDTVSGEEARSLARRVSTPQRWDS